MQRCRGAEVQRASSLRLKASRSGAPAVTPTTFGLGSTANEAARTLRGHCGRTYYTCYSTYFRT